MASMPLWTGWPATTTPGIATRRFPPAVILCELCVLFANNTPTTTWGKITIFWYPTPLCPKSSAGWHSTLPSQPAAAPCSSARLRPKSSVTPRTSCCVLHRHRRNNGSRTRRRRQRRRRPCGHVAPARWSTGRPTPAALPAARPGLSSLAPHGRAAPAPL